MKTIRHLLLTLALAGTSHAAQPIETLSDGQKVVIRNAVLPAQAGATGKYLKTDGSSATWETVTAGKTDSMTTNRLLGRGTAGTGVIEEITLGTNLSLSGNTLNAAGGAATVDNTAVNAAIATAPATTRTSLGLGTAATADASTTGGANKVLQYDSSGNLTMGVLTGTNTLNSSGNIQIPNFKAIEWYGADGALSARQYLIDGHSGGDELITSSPRHCYYWTGGMQFGSPATARDGRYIYIQPNTATVSDTLVEGVPISLDTHFWNPALNGGAGGDDGNAVILQAIPLTATTGGDVFRVNMGGTIDGNHRVTGGITAAEFSRTGLNHPGTNPSFTALTPGATVTWTLSKYLNRQHATLTTGQDTTLVLSGALAGMSGTLVVTQGAATAPDTLALPAGSKTPGATDGVVTLSTAADAVDVLEWVFDGTYYYWKNANNYTATADVDAANYISRASVTDTAQKTALNNYVLGLKSDGIWTKLTAVYPFLGSGSTQAQYGENLLSNTYDLTWVGAGPTRGPDGLTGTSAASYADYAYGPAASNVTGTPDSLFMYCYNKTTLPTDGSNFVGSNTTTNTIMYRYTTSLAIDGLNRSAGVRSILRTASPANDWRGHLSAMITSSTTQSLWQNSAETTGARTSSAANTTPLEILRHSDATLAIVTIGQTLNNTEYGNFRTRTQTFLTAIGRQN